MKRRHPHSDTRPPMPRPSPAPSSGARSARIAVAGLLATAAGLASCGPSAPVGPAAAPPGKAPAVAKGPAAPPAAPLVLPTFVDVADEAGIVVYNHTGKPAQKDWLVSAMGGGTMALDYDQDGDMDIVVVDGTMLSTEGVLQFSPLWTTRLFRNDGGGMHFTDVSEQAGVALQAFGFGGASCDYDADGYPDFYVCCWGKSHLFHNRGDGTFEDVSEKAGVTGSDRDMSTACAWGDVNGDGIHDLYVATYADQRAFIDDTLLKGAHPRSAIWREFRVYVGPSPLPPQKDRLYLGNGDGTFRDASATNLLDQKDLYGFQPVMADVDNDGDLDIYVANDTQVNNLWVNDGKGVFRDMSVHASVATNQEMTEQAGMGVDAEDFNRDGWIDLTVTNFSHDYNTVYLNRTAKSGVLSFTDSSNVLGVATASYHRLAWAVRFLDYDNDGFLDHMTTCGHVYGEIDGFEKSTQSSYRQQCQLLRSAGPTSWKLTDVTNTSGPALQMKRVWRGASFGDFDDDGDTDVFVAALNDKAALFRNDGGNRNSWVRFKLIGKGGLRDPSGARVLLRMPSGLTHMSELHHGASFCSDNDPRMLFGLGALDVVPTVDVEWPGGQKQTFKNVAGRRAYVIEQGVDTLRPDEPKPK